MNEAVMPLSESCLVNYLASYASTKAPRSAVSAPTLRCTRPHSANPRIRPSGSGNFRRQYAAVNADLRTRRELCYPLLVSSKVSIIGNRQAGIGSASTCNDASTLAQHTRVQRPQSAASVATPSSRISRPSSAGSVRVDTRSVTSIERALQMNLKVRWEMQESKRRFELERRRAEERRVAHELEQRRLAAEARRRALMTPDEHALDLKPNAPETERIETLADYLVEPWSSNEARHRTIFSWLAYRVEHALDATQQEQETVQLTGMELAQAVLQSRVASSRGFAALYEQLAHAANLACATVHGFAKPPNFPLTPLSNEHVWVQVQFDEGGEWHVADPAFGAGDFDATGRFIQSFNAQWWKTPADQFASTHLPHTEDGGPPAPVVAQFREGPRLCADYFASGLELQSHKSAEVKAPAGKKLMIQLRQNTLSDRKVRGNLDGDVDAVAVSFDAKKGVHSVTVTVPKGVSGRLQLRLTWVGDTPRPQPLVTYILVAGK